MARENGILADKFNTFLLDAPIPLSVYKNLKKKKIPRFRPKSLRDYMKYMRQYSDTFDETDYNKEALEDIIRHWFTLAEEDDYAIEQAIREIEENSQRSDNEREDVSTPGGMASAQYPHSPQSSQSPQSPHSNEAEVKSEQGIPDSPDSGDSAVLSAGSVTRGEAPSLGDVTPTPFFNLGPFTPEPPPQELRPINVNPVPPTPPTFLHRTDLRVIRPRPSPATLERDIEDLDV